MTDKEKIKAEVSTLIGEALLEHAQYATSPNILYDLKKEYSEKIVALVDSMQEEPLSVWHDGNTLPINYEIEDILVVYNQYGREYLHLYWEEGIYSDAQGLSKYNWKYVEKWAYIKDLLKH